MRDLEANIVYETEHFYAYRTHKDIEIRKKAQMVSYVIGSKKRDDVEGAKKICDRLEPYHYNV